MSKLDTIVIGLGKQSCEDHLPALVASSFYNLVAVVESDGKRLQEIAKQYGVPGFASLKAFLQSEISNPDVAIVAVPHNAYIPIITELANHKINVIKEKPFAINFAEAKEFKRLAEENSIRIFVTLQRRFNPIFTTFNQLVKYIGEIYSIEARYTMNIARLDKGWRAHKEVAGGGALIDMGYHFVDLLIWYFGLPNSINCKLSRSNRSKQIYDVEDTALVSFTYNEDGGDEKRILGNMLISRVYPAKEESLTVYGSAGSVQVQRGRLCRKDIDGNEIEILERQGSWPSAIIDQLEYFAKRIQHDEDIDDKVSTEYMEHIAFIEASYASNLDSCSHDPNDYLKGRLSD